MSTRVDLLKPVESKLSTGEVVCAYELEASLLADIKTETSNGSGDAMLPGGIDLQFDAAAYPVQTDWKVAYNGQQYSIDSVSRIGRGVYSTYRCSLIKIL